MNFFLYELLPTILNMSITGSIVIVVVLAIRLLLKKAPKIFSYAIWAVVLFRLLCPFSFESAIGLLPSSEPIPVNIVHQEYPQVDLPLPIISDVINENLPQGEVQVGADPLEAPMSIATLMWAVGILAMLIYSAVQYALLKRKLIGAKLLRDNIYLADGINSPFVTGLLKPKIYLPSALPKSEYDFIIAHEKCHIKRLDHITRILSFVAVALHWFNPLVWVAYIVSAKDMEMSCDEAVMKNMDSDIRAEYSTSLLRLATGKNQLFATPLAFGEGDTKGRVKNVMNYKKPVVWVSAICFAVVLAVLFGFMGNRVPALEEPPTIYAHYDYGVVEMNLGTYSWTYNGTSTETDSIHPTEMDYPNPISYNENKGHRNANITFSLNNDSENIEWNDEYGIVELWRYKDGVEDFHKTMNGGNWIDISLEDNSSYVYEFKIEFEDGNTAHYSVQIDNNVTENGEEPLLWDLPPMVMVDGEIYLDTGELGGETLFQDPERSDFDGFITSTVNGNESPTQNDQSNFGEGFGYRVIDTEKIAIYINEEWYIFKIEEKAPLELFQDLSADGEIELTLDEIQSYSFKTNSEQISITIKSPEELTATIMLYDVLDNANSIMQFDLSTGETKTFSNLTSSTYYFIRTSLNDSDLTLVISE